MCHCLQWWTGGVDLDVRLDGVVLDPQVALTLINTVPLRSIVSFSAHPDQFS